MNLRFDKLLIRNFKSFEGEHVLDLQAPGLYFVRGRNEAEPALESNGAGKSSIWDALCWCLFGRTPDGLRNPDVRPWFGKGQTLVALSLTTDKKHELVRTIKPNTLVLDKRTVGQEQVEELLGVSYAVFTNTVLLGQGQPLFFDLKPQQKMELFSEVLSLERWDQRSTHANEEANKLEQELGVLQAEASGLTAQIEDTARLLAAAEEASTLWREERKQQLDSAARKIKALESSVNKQQRELDKHDLAHDGATTELRALEAQSAKYEQKARALRDRSATFTAQRESAKAELRRAREELKELGKGDKCPTCGQSLTGTALARHHRKLADKCAELEKAAEAQPPKKLVEDIAVLDAEIKRWEKSREAFRHKSYEAEDASQSLKETLAQDRAALNELQRAVKQQEEDLNPHAPLLNKLRKQHNRLLKDQEELVEYMGWLERKVARTRFWVKGFKEIRLLVVDDVLQELTLVTNAMLDTVGLVGWEVRYDIERQTKSGSTQTGLNVAILSPDRDEPARWESWSGGEGQRLRLVGAFALSEVLLAYAGVQPSLEVLDEPSRGLARGGVYDLCDLLADRAQQLGKAVWYCDHMSVESNLFDGVLVVTKDNKGSRLAWR